MSTETEERLARIEETLAAMAKTMGRLLALLDRFEPLLDRIKPGGVVGRAVERRLGIALREPVKR